MIPKIYQVHKYFDDIDFESLSDCFVVKTNNDFGSVFLVKKALRPYREKVLTITFDNGKEFAGHQKIAKKLKADCYFADPYSSWQRGSNENLNGLVRQYFPKGKTDFTRVSQKEMDEVERKLNNRPRKRLNWRSPAMVFTALSH